METVTQSSCEVSIFVAGDPVIAKQICADWVYSNPRCVTVTETEFIYRGGREVGVVVGIRNYPRFPASKEELWNVAEALAKNLIESLSQDSAMIQDSEKVLWITRREP